jgi:hypothetical protein
VESCARLKVFAAFSQEDAQTDTLSGFEAARPRVGGFSGVELRNYAGSGRSVNLFGNYMGETIVSKGGSWRFHACKV